MQKEFSSKKEERKFKEEWELLKYGYEKLDDGTYVDNNYYTRKLKHNTWYNLQLNPGYIKGYPRRYTENHNIAT